MKDQDLVINMVGKVEKAVSDLSDSVDDLRKEVDELREDIHQVDKTLGKQQVILDEHIRRTEASENRLELLEKAVVPLEKHVLLFAGAAKLLVVIGTIVSIAVGLMKIFNINPVGM